MAVLRCLLRVCRRVNRPAANSGVDELNPDSEVYGGTGPLT
jgi:hypothetical protein